MKSTGKYIGTLGLVLAFAAAVLAHGVGEHIAKMKTELGLTDAQAAQLQQKFEALRPAGEQAEERLHALRSEVEALEKSATPDQKAISAKRAEMESIKRDWKGKADAIYRSVLTKEQYEKLQTLQAKEKKEYAAKEREEKEKKH